MATEPPREEPTAAAGDDLEQATKQRREADLRLSMNERLAALHYLCLEASQVRDAAKRGEHQNRAEPD